MERRTEKDGRTGKILITFFLRNVLKVHILNIYKCTYSAVEYYDLQNFTLNEY